MKVAVLGATGFVGLELCEKLVRDGHEVVALGRNLKSLKSKVSFVSEWIDHDFSQSKLSDQSKLAKLKGVQAFYNLSGENIGEKSWNKENIQSFYRSRVELGRNLIQTLDDINAWSDMKVFFQTSAIGYYRESRDDEFLDESSEKEKEFFFGELCDAWENVVRERMTSNEYKNTRFIIGRIGVVLGLGSGLLGKLLPVYRLGLGGVIGSGKQWMSWIHMKDLICAMTFFLESGEGVFNLVGPNPCQNKEFNKALSQACQRPAFFKVPAQALKIGLGKKSYLALSSQRISTRLTKDLKGFSFEFQDIFAALENLCHFKKTDGMKKKAFHHEFKRVKLIGGKKIKEVFPFFADAYNLEKITPPLLNFKILSVSTDQVQKGTQIIYQLKVHGIPLKWVTNIQAYEENKMFVDQQEKGPYQQWHHTHSFYPCLNGVLMVDKVLFRLPFGFLGELFGLWLVKRDVAKIFNYRNEVIESYLA